MVLPSHFSHTLDRGTTASSKSPTEPLDAFLDNQPQAFYENIYKSEAACLCILRLLPPVCRQIVLHALWSYQTLRTSDLKAFCGMDERLSPENAEEVIRAARNRHVFLALTHRGNKFQWPLSETFKKGLRNALTGLGTSNSFGVPSTSGEPGPGTEFLISHGEDSWETILKYMVSSGLSAGYTQSRPRNSVLQLLYQSELMIDPTATDPRREPRFERLTITSKGFQFLLEDRQMQLWQILMFYITSMQADGEDAAGILSLFFSLGCMQLGQGYSVSKSFPRHAAVLRDLEQYGFVYLRNDEVFPTHLATALCSGDTTSSRSQSADDKRFLILETNYKIYAYTSNELEIAILNLFVDIRIRYPNLVVGKLDRSHVKAAMDKGISAKQIIAYLSSHAHPQMYNHPPPLLHSSVTDQLHLWDQERNRLGTQETNMLSFFSKELYEDTRDEAKRNAGLQHCDDAQKIIFIEPTIREAIREFIQARQSELRALRR